MPSQKYPFKNGIFEGIFFFNLALAKTFFNISQKVILLVLTHELISKFARQQQTTQHA
jgi:hypothetical protein